MQILELKFLMMCLPFLQERDNMQKSEFLKALSDMWKDFDSRVLRYKVCSMLFGYEIYVFSLLLVNFVSRLSPSIHNLYSPASIYNPGYSCCQLLCLVPYNFNSQYGLSSFHGFWIYIALVKLLPCCLPKYVIQCYYFFTLISLEFWVCFFHYCHECNLDK